GLLARRLAAQTNTDARQQLLEAKRFRDVVVGPGLEPGEGRVELGARGEHDDGHPLAALSDARQHLDSVDGRQADVEDEQVEVIVASDRCRELAVVDRERRVAGGREAALEELGDARLVLGDQDSGHSVSSIWSTGRSIVNVAPPPGVLSRSTLPPWASTTAVTIARPSPAPSDRRRPCRPRANRSKMRPCSSEAMP